MIETGVPTPSRPSPIHPLSPVHDSTTTTPTTRTPSERKRKRKNQSSAPSNILFRPKFLLIRVSGGRSSSLLFFHNPQPVSVSAGNLDLGRQSAQSSTKTLGRWLFCFFFSSHGSSSSRRMTTRRDDDHATTRHPGFLLGSPKKSVFSSPCRITFTPYLRRIPATT